MRVIDELGVNLDVMALGEARDLAKQKGLDLIEIVPTANPPVVKIMSYDKYRYQEEKKAKKQRAAQKIQEFKQVQIGVRSAAHDLSVKAARVNEFMQAGHQVEIQLVLRGREKANRDWGKKKLLEFLTIIDPNHKVISEPRPGGRGFTVLVIKNK